MKNFLKKILVTAAVLMTTVSFTQLASSQSAYADCRYLLGMQSWDCHVDIDKINSTDTLTSGIWVIASNILIDLTIIAGYLVLGYTIYGGYLYIFASGDAGKVARGKKTLTHAFIGLGIVASVYVILNAIRIALLGSGGSFAENCATTECANPTEIVTNALGWLIGIGGAIALVFVVIGGVGYVTSAGDPGKLKKAKDTILYALIGLAVVALSEIIVAFVSNIVYNAANNDQQNNASYIEIINNKELS